MRKLEEQENFFELVSQPFYLADLECIEKVCRSVWGGRLDLEGYRFSFDMMSLRRAGYVIDKLSRFSCLDLTYKRSLRKVVGQLESLVGITDALVSGEVRLDSLAIKWGLDEDLKSEVRSLLKFQTRHENP